MQIDIVDSPDKRFEEYIIKAIEFAGEKLIPHKSTRKSITIHVKFVASEDFGGTEIVSRNIKNQAREFNMILHPHIGAQSILETIMHEMVHIKQYVTGELTEYQDTWKNYNLEPIEDYYDHPWEIEAHGVEVGLFRRFAEKEILWDILEGIGNPEDPIVEEPIRWKIK